MERLELYIEPASFVDAKTNQTIKFNKYYVNVDAGGKVGTQKVYLAPQKNDRFGKDLLKAVYPVE